MSRPAGSAEKPSAAFTIIAAPSRSRRGSGRRPISQVHASVTSTLVNGRPVGGRPELGGLRVVDRRLVGSIMAQRVGGMQSHVATAVLKQDLDSQKSTVL